MAHFNHPREMTDITMQVVEQLHRAGIVVVNQTPVLNEVNSDPDTLTQLFRKLSFAGVSPYYVFQCRPSLGNLLFQTPVEYSYDIIQQAWQACSGLAKRARFVMSHATGKIEVVGKTAHHVVMRYHQAADPVNIGKTMIFSRNPMAHWFDDYRHHGTPLVDLLPVQIPKMKWMF